MIKAVQLILALLFAAALGAGLMATQIPDRDMEGLADETCVPIYYSGLECCKG